MPEELKGEPAAMEKKVAAVDGVTAAKAAYLEACERLKNARLEEAAALKAQAVALDALQNARILLRKESEGEDL